MVIDFSSLCDPLYCEEDRFEEESEDLCPLNGRDEEESEHLFPLNGGNGEEEEEDEEWAETLSFLVANEGETHPELSAAAGDVYLSFGRRPAVEWVVKTGGQHAFSVQTVLLAVNYLDRCFLPAGGLTLQEDKPWMARLAAVACLSLAAKVEETRVPLLLDLQLPPAPAAAPPAAGGEEVGYLFENRTIGRMEILVLSTLGWRMNPVTPLSVVRRLLPKIPAGSGGQRAHFGRCAAALLAVVADWRWIRYPPSVWAAAALHAVGRPVDSPEMHLPLELLNISKEQVRGACNLILELSAAGGDSGDSGDGVCSKRRHICYRECGSVHCYSSFGSPNSLVGSCFTYESSSNTKNSSSTTSSSFSEPPPFKKPKQNRDNGESKELAVGHGILLA